MGVLRAVVKGMAPPLGDGHCCAGKAAGEVAEPVGRAVPAP